MWKKFKQNYCNTHNKETTNFNTYIKREVTENEKKIAEKIKIEGNELFLKAKYDAAIEKYTEAVTLWPEFITAILNRANCYKQKGNWKMVEIDCEKVLSLDQNSMKAHYFLALVYGKKMELKQAIIHLRKALELAREKDDNIKDQIWRELAKLNYKLWENDAIFRKNEFDYLKLILSHHDIYPDDKSKWDTLFEKAIEKDKRKEPLSCFTCPLTMEIFREPVITPCGMTYEKSAIIQHLQSNGNFDPITRKALSLSQLIPNTNLQAAIENYLDENPWAWKDCV